MNPVKENLNPYEILRPFIDGITFEDENHPNPISVVVPTFNRSPHPLEHDSNPLAWCLESLLAQQNTNLAEIVVVDDNSADYTIQVVNHFTSEAAKQKVKLKLIRNPENIGSSRSRNIGIRESESQLIMFVDDDCVFDPRMLFGAAFTLDSLPESAAAIHVPIYHRSRNPTIINAKEVGVLDLDNGVIKGNFGGFPAEYLANPELNLLDTTRKIFKPIPIQTIGGIFLAKKDRLEKVGGFPKDINWRNSYREEDDLALRLRDQGNTLWFTPDPKFGSIHLKYGAVEQIGTDELDEGLAYKINRANVPVSESGNRVSPEEWFHDVIMATYVTLGRRNPRAAEEYAISIHGRFVEENNFAVSGVGTKISEKARRTQIYGQAIEDAKKHLNRLELRA